MELDRDLEWEREYMHGELIPQGLISDICINPDTWKEKCDMWLRTEPYEEIRNRTWWQYAYRLAMQVIREREQSADAPNNHT